ncbi:hypothetical protein RHQ60_004769 [Citrobacter amalonaticus]|nr:hypothetical protein [Citrobacter amalonaticus]
MKHTVVKTSVALLMLAVTAATAGAATHVGVDRSTIVTKTVDLIFQGETAISFDLTAAQDHFSTDLKDGTTLARGLIGVTGSASQVAYHFATGSAGQIATPDSAQLTGKANGGVLNVKFSEPEGAKATLKDEWMVTDEAVAQGASFTLNIVANGAQANVTPDTYTATVEAASWEA